MSGECCHCCERRELVKQCRIDMWTGVGGKTVQVLHIPTGAVVIGVDKDDVLDTLDALLARKLASCVN